MFQPAWLQHRRFLPWLLVVTFLLCLPMLQAGLFLDDYLQRTVLLTGSEHPLFSFLTRGEPRVEAQYQAGILPWWFWPEAKVRFLRPLAAWLSQADYALWPDSVPLMHLHSVLWYVALVAVAALAYRRYLPVPAVAALATLLFALDYRHAGGVTWLCNRNVLIALLLSLLVLICHRSHRPGLRVLAIPLFALSLGAGEAALAVTGYLLAHELFLSDRTHGRRVLALLPYALIAGVWIAIWQVMGYGVSGPDFYVDLVHHPQVFLEKLALRAPSFLISQLFLPPAEVFAGLEIELNIARDAVRGTLLVIALLIALAAVFWPLLQRSANARFFALGMVIAVIPISTSMLASRALWYVGFGGAGLVALYLTQPGIVSRWRRLVVVLLIAVHLVLSPLLFVATPFAFKAVDASIDARRTGLVTTPPARRLLLISTGVYLFTVTAPLLKAESLGITAHGGLPPSPVDRILGLIHSPGRYVLARPARDQLVLTSPDGMYGLGRSPYGFTAGQVLTLPDVRIRIDRVTPLREPLQVTFTFSADALAGYRVLTWENDRFLPARLPVVGERLALQVR